MYKLYGKVRLPDSAMNECVYYNHVKYHNVYVRIDIIIIIIVVSCTIGRTFLVREIVNNNKKMSGIPIFAPINTGA